MNKKYFLLIAAALLMVLSACKKEGCTDINASNYDPEAKKNDGSCIYPVEGCTDPNSLNYDPMADVDDGSCEYAEVYAPMKAGNTWTLEDQITILGQTADIIVTVTQVKDTTYNGHDWVIQTENIAAGGFGDQTTTYAYRMEGNTGKVYRQQLLTDSLGIEQLYIDYPLELGHSWYDTEAQDNFQCTVQSTSLLSVPAGNFTNAIGIQYTELNTNVPSVFYFIKDIGPGRIDIEQEVPFVGQINVQAELTSYTVN